MIAFVASSAILLTAMQASIAAPTDAFRGCLREAMAKATSEKVAGDAIEAYLRTACTTQMSTLKTAVIAFRMKNGMSRRAAADEALVMGLRLTEGVDAGAIADRFGLAPVVDWIRIDRLAASGHLRRNGTHISLTASGRLLLDHILGQIAAEQPRALAVG